MTQPDCIPWHGNIMSNGYGRLKSKGRTYRAHRFVYESTHGPIPEGFIIRHKCDNPPCVNPTHLEIGTHKDNTRDEMVRTRSRLGETNPNVKLSNANVREIRFLYASTDVTQKQLALKYGVSKATIWYTLKGKTWQ